MRGGSFEAESGYDDRVSGVACNPATLPCKISTFALSSGFVFLGTGPQKTGADDAMEERWQQRPR